MIDDRNYWLSCVQNDRLLLQHTLVAARGNLRRVSPCSGCKKFNDLSTSPSCCILYIDTYGQLAAVFCKQMWLLSWTDAGRAVTTSVYGPVSAILLQYFFLTFITSCSVQEAFDAFYETGTGLLNHFHPECTITVTSRDPAYVTPSLKAMLRRKNRLMRAGKI